MDAPPYVLEWFNYVRKHDIRHILMVAKWNRLYKTDTLAYTDNKPVTEENLRNDLRAVVNEFIREGRQIWIMDQVPQFTKDPILIVRVLDDRYSEEYSPEKIRNFLADTFTDPEAAGVHILDPVPLLLDGNRLRPIRNNLFMYRDPNHISVDGALAIKDVFRPFFQSML